MGTVVPGSLFLWCSPLRRSSAQDEAKFLRFSHATATDRGENAVVCRCSESYPRGARSGTKASRIEDYNTAMNRMMRNPTSIITILAMNYSEISDDLIVGSQPQKPDDIDHLKEEQNVAYILCLPQDKDIAYWDIDFDAILRRCCNIGVRHMRTPARDFVPDSLRSQLPRAMSSLE